MFTVIRNAWKIPDLRKKLLFTLFILLIYRLGNAVPVPFVDVAALSAYFQQSLSDTVLGLYNAMSGTHLPTQLYLRCPFSRIQRLDYFAASVHCNPGSGAAEQRGRRRWPPQDCQHYPLGDGWSGSAHGYGLYRHAAQLQSADQRSLLQLCSDCSDLYGRLGPSDVAGRADHGIWHWQRYFHYPVCLDHLPVCRLQSAHYSPT